MAEPRELRHIVYSKVPEPIPYTNPRSVSQRKRRPYRNPQEHADRLLVQLEQSWAAVTHDETHAVAVPDKEGMYLAIELADDCEDVLKSLDPARKGTRLCNYKKLEIKPQNTEGTRTINTATIYIPDAERQDFIQKLTDYRNERINGKPKYNDLISSIDSIQKAIVKALWTDDERYFPAEEKVWCEIWLDVPDQNYEEVKAQFFNLCSRLDIATKTSSLVFPNVCVVAVHANGEDLQVLLQKSSEIDEIRQLKKHSYV